MTLVRYHRLAEHEAEHAVDWYETRKPGLGAEFLSELKRSERVIVERPLMWPIWPGAPSEIGVRRYILPRFPYALAYLAEDVPIILAVAHLRRRPLYWLGRTSDRV